METAMMTVERKTAQEDQDHDGGEAGCNDGLAHHAVDGAATKIDWSERKLIATAAAEFP